MSTAHVCIRSALTQAFRPSTRGIAASYSVASFLIPSLAQPCQRSFSSGRRRCKEQQLVTRRTAEKPHDAPIYRIPHKPDTKPLRSRLSLPHPDQRADIQKWLAVLEPCLPPELRRHPITTDEKGHAVTALDLALFVNAAQDVSVDILSHLGVEEGRWPIVIWMTKKLVEDGRRSIDYATHLDPSANIVWPDIPSRSLKELTEVPLRLERSRPSRKLTQSLNDLTSPPESISLQHVAIKRALGQLWRSLGSMILAGAERNVEEDLVMPHVLEIIAYLHHMGFMPDSVYTYRPHENSYALQQPPTLHMLSTKILTALSDASWKAHEATVKLAKNGAKASYFLGHEIPGSAYRLRVTEVAPELWLELVLWSCLHGGWTLDGLAILERLAIQSKKHSWGLISWREILLAERQHSPAPSKLWKLFPMSGESAAQDSDRARTRKTISSEIVTAFVDAAVSEVRVGVGFRGLDPDLVVGKLKTLKGFLDSNNLSLGSAAWGSIMARLLESGAFVPEKRPEVLLCLFELAPLFGAEVGTANTSATASAEVPYFFEPTTVPLNLLHRTMRAFIANGDIKGAMATLNALQQHTDDNKQKSVQQFFEMLKNEMPRKEEPFTSHLPPVDFPAFDISMPVPLRAKLLDLATESKIYDLGRWFLFAPDLDGPLISRDLYSHRNVASSIVRFGTLAGENDLVLKIVEKAGTWNAKYQQQRMPAEVLTALFCSQVKLQRWNSVRSMQQYVMETSTFRPRPIVLSAFAAELLRTSSGAEEDRLKAQDAFAEFLFAWENIIFRNIKNELYCILAIISTVDHTWKEFCSQFLAISLRQDVKLSTAEFNHILRGILDGYGTSRGRVAVEAWCYTAPEAFGSYRAPGGLSRMPHFRVDPGAEYDERPEDIELGQDSGAILTLRGRVQPNRQTIWAILRKVQEELDHRRRRGEELSVTERGETRDTLRWAARLLHYLGYDYEDIVRDMGSSLAGLAELEGFAAATHSGHLDGADPRPEQAVIRQLA
ncbi:hypothetical protein EK21DRAFT_108764 [Setomelanomma holmii]|uniref:Uncharacterized protein n=1 Tax=Setomelanomma holmii TaxID=210430 RepID=A0A9P4HG64_9PLEO|nr:hypothetical protein EK21DRAFT_108764 [Setomelanomma holmii]